MPRKKLPEEERIARKKESDLRRNRKYMQKVRQVMVKFNLETEESAMFDFIDNKGNMQGYIKKLIQRDMAGKVDWED